MKKLMTLLMALTMCCAINAQEIEKIDKFASGYINGTYMNKYKTIDGVLYAVGYEGTKDWILVRYPAGSRNTTYNVHPNCRRIARGAFEGAAYLREIYLPETVSFIGEDAFAGRSNHNCQTGKDHVLQMKKAFKSLYIPILPPKL